MLRLTQRGFRIDRRDSEYGSGSNTVSGWAKNPNHAVCPVYVTRLPVPELCKEPEDADSDDDAGNGDCAWGPGNMRPAWKWPDLVGK